MSSSVTLGAMLRTAREGKRLQQQEAAELIGVTRSTLWRWETNQRQPAAAQLEAVCAVLDLKRADVVRAAAMASS